jgi:hypothetical protein
MTDGLLPERQEGSDIFLDGERTHPETEWVCVGQVGGGIGNQHVTEHEGIHSLLQQLS